MEKKKKLWPYLFLAIIIVAVDQWVKSWVRGNFSLGETKAFLPNLVELTYVQNTGAAFSMLSEHTWLLTVVSAVAALVILVVLYRRTLPHAVGNIALAMVFGGAVGNLIDRACLGFVVDMFSLEFINFAVFNVADIGVTVGGVLLCIYILFGWKEEEAV